jgi:hypothetical protein
LQARERTIQPIGNPVHEDGSECPAELADGQKRNGEKSDSETGQRHLIGAQAAAIEPMRRRREQARGQRGQTCVEHLRSAPGNRPHQITFVSI